MTNYDFGVLIGRFQLFHDGYFYLIKNALAKVNRLIIIIGSVKRARTLKNPWTFEERRQLILDNLIAYDKIYGTRFSERVCFVANEDDIYDEEAWMQSIRDSIADLTGGKAVALFGHLRDHSTYYLKAFTDIEFIELGKYMRVSSSDLRTLYFLGKKEVEKLPCISKATRDFLSQFQKTPEYATLMQEAIFLEAYQSWWQNTPYPPVFSTIDPVVICNEHILLMQRKYRPGHGVWALPGGFIEANEWITEALLRKLKREMGMREPADELRTYLQRVKTYDYPERSQLCRVLTHAGLFRLPYTKLPDLHPSTEVMDAKWLKLDDFWKMSAELYEDHYYIVKDLLKEPLRP